MYVLIEDDDLLKIFNHIWNKVGNNMKKKFDSKPNHNKKFIKSNKIILW